LPPRRSDANPRCVAFLAFSAHLNEYNVRIAKDDKKAKEGELEFITPPKADGGGGKKKRTFGLRSRKRGITYAPVQKGPAIVDERGGILFTA